MIDTTPIIHVDTVADPGGPRGPWPPFGPVKISYKKDGRQNGRIDFMFLAPQNQTKTFKATSQIAMYTKKYNAK